MFDALRALLSRQPKAREYDRLRDSLALSAREVFGDVYKRKAWFSATADRELYSGPGSNLEFAQPYAEAVKQFAQKHGARKIVDLGCGDFRVGALLATPPFDYIGVDVVDAVIDYNIDRYKADGIQFLRRDITSDPLPDGDLCLVREVFQHLSNGQIVKALGQMSKYRWCLVSDREPAPAASANPNVDRPQGAESRTDLMSALRFDLPPFNQKNVRLLFETPSATRALPHSSIKTYLIANG